MVLWTAGELHQNLKETSQNPASAYLVTGERYLCRQALQDLEQTLIAPGGTVHAIDGEEETADRIVSRLRSFSLLPGRQIYRVTDTRIFHSKNVAGLLWKRASKAHQDGKNEVAARHLRAMFAAAGLDPANPDNRPGALSKTAWKKNFGFAHPGGDLDWADRLLDKAATVPEQSTTGEDAADRLQAALEEGIAENNILILVAEEVDRRKRLFRYFRDHQVIIDLAVEQGSSSRARAAQKSVLQDLVCQTLRKMGKTMDGGVMDLLLERVGFHPVAVVMETEKLCLHADDRPRITRTDLDLLVGRTRQEALFELTGAVGEGQCGRAMVLVSRLMAGGIHPLAIVATLRNSVRTLLLFRALQDDPETGFQPSMPAQAFQKQVLPRLKERGQWTRELGGHPYAVYMQFKTAARFDLATLKNWMSLLLTAERRLKGSGLEPTTVLDHLLASMLIADRTSVS